MLKSCVSVLALAALPGVLSASTVQETVWFGGNAGLLQRGDDLTFTSDGGVGITASAHTLNSDGTVGSDQRLGQYGFGLGVSSHRGDDHQVDGAGIDEVITLSFDTSITIESVWFTHVGFNDDFAFSMIDGEREGEFFSSIDIPGGWRWDFGIGQYNFSQEWIGSVFGFGATGANDDFKLAGISFSYDMPDVPLPAGGALLLSGLAGMAYMRRRKAAKAA